MIPRPPARPPLAVRALLHPVLLPALVLVLLAGCAFQREVISTEGSPPRTVALLTGTAEPEEPPAAGFATLSRLEAETSLRRIRVKVANVVAFLTSDDADPLLSPAQVRWASAVLARHLPTLRPDQRLELSFRDRFHGLLVEAQVYPDGPHLIYRFTKLASPDRSSETARDIKTELPPAFVELTEQPGQIADYDRTAYILQDPLFAVDASGVAIQDKLAVLYGARDAGDITAADAEAAEAVVRAHATVGVEALRLYVGKVKTLNNAREQGLFSAAEVAERKQGVLAELQP